MKGTTRSFDATDIHWTRTGTGPAIVFVHGGLADGSAWSRVVPLLEPHATCCVIDRRGYGASESRDAAALARECEDIAAVVEALDQDATVFGHSSGALCALGAAGLTDRITALVLYEPPLRVGPPVVAPAVLEAMQRAISAGDHARAWQIGMERVVRYTPEEIDAARRNPRWQERLAMMPRWVMELAAIDALGPDAMGLEAVERPVLLMLGTRTADHHTRATAMLSELLPDARVQLLPDQGHLALHTAPALVADAALAFVSNVGGLERVAQSR